MSKIYLLAFCASLLALSQVASSQNIVINEILTSNTIINVDEDGTHQDWVELYNKGTVSVNLNGYGLTDDSSAPFKWVFPNVSLAPNQYLLVWCSDKNRAIPGSPLHTNFKISSSGETISLTTPGGVTVNSVPATALDSDLSYGRLPNGTGSFVFFQNVTPNAQNTGTGYSGFLTPPLFSQESGFFTNSFGLTLTTTEPGATILYTLDGSEPDPAHIGGTTYQYKNQYPENPGQATGPLLDQSYATLQYSTPITIVDRTPQANKISAISSTYSFDPSYYIPDSNIFKGTVVRVKTIKTGMLSSKTDSRSYFVAPQGPNRFSIPVVSLSFTESKFFDYDEGIYVAGVDFDTWRVAHPTLFPRGREVGNYYRRGIENERRANMSYFVNGAEVLNMDVGLRIRGASTRRYESKALTVYARSEYGDGSLSYKFFPDLADTSFGRITLSNSGSDFRNTMFRDALAHRVCQELHCENENYQPTITFLNGEYWGILNIRERFDNNYFQRVYNIDEVDLLENQGEDAEEGDEIHYQSMISFVENNSLATPANYNYILTQLDPESFSDHFITNIYFDNSDWPNNNVMYWRKRTASYMPNAPYGHDGRWRWIFHDMDDTFSFGTDDFYHDNLLNATTFSESGTNQEWATLLLRKMLENPDYKNDFISRFADLLNTSFLSSRVISIMNTMKSGIVAEMPEHITRWSLPDDMESFDYYTQYQADFANARPSIQRDQIRSKFGISSNINATLNVSAAAHGYIKINTIEVKNGTPGIAGNPYPWTGIYFSNIPVKLKAIANEGYIFSHWTGASTSTDPEITITSAGSFSVTAVFIQSEPTLISEPIYFWMMNNSIPNNIPLTSLNSTYELLGDGVIAYQSSLAGYPFTSVHPSWRKASMERRNSPTPLNYRPQANGNVPYAPAIMKGLQITQPFQSGGLQNTMVFNTSTVGYKNIKFSFAVLDEGAATGLLIDYSINAGAPIWITTGLATPAPALTSSYQLLETDFTAITAVNNNPDFKIRIRFTGPNMTADLGNRVTFNNIALDGVKMPVTYPTPQVYTAGTAIAPLTPTVSGGTVLTFSVAPALPAGLTLNTTTGVITGTPTIQSAATTYTVTANYSGGNATFGISITVNPAAPSNLSYTSPNTFMVGSPIANLTPTVTGTVSSYGISPSLPAGLSFNTSTGVISGNPSAITSTATYTVTATNLSGNTSFGVIITVNNTPPSSLSYPSPNIFTVNTPISNLNPTVSGGTVVSYNVSPALPVGLTINSTTGVISGTPTAMYTTGNYTVTATNSGGNTSFIVVITVNNVAPNSLNYPSPNIFTVDSAITPLNPTVSGGAVTNYSVTPSLPVGLVLNASTGVISGTPSTVTATSGYVVTASNSGGNTAFNIVITVNAPTPNSLSYPSPNIFTTGTPITPLNPTISGGAPTSYNVSPSLPAGLSLNTATGVISGTPTVITATQGYMVTAVNSGGNSSFSIVITINNIAPSGLSYNSPNVLSVGASATLNPTISGGTATNYSVAPALPAGLSLNASTGVISGTPTATSASSSYLVTASNSGGSTSFSIVISVTDTAPSALSYPTPNIFNVGTAITPLNPTVSGGTVVSFSVLPSLPAGLDLNTDTGVISGTPTAMSASANYLVTATNGGGSTSFSLNITVNDTPPSGLSYPSPNVYTVGVAITPLDHSMIGSGFTYSVLPALPTGLTLNTENGEITGTPTEVTATAAYTVTATNTAGSTSFDIVITVNDVPPSGLSYDTPSIFTVNSAIVSLSPTISGGTTNSYSISPALPQGLMFDLATGVISGTPTAIMSAALFEVTAHNSGGDASFMISITINDVPPAGLSYNSPNIFTVGTVIVPLSPSVSGGTVTTYSVTPLLPSSLSIDTSTGVISGTPNSITATSAYTVTASNSGGTTSFDIVITVNDSAPISLSYPSPNIFAVNTVISALNPTITGGTATSFSVSPALPAGLNLNTSTGVISGTPTAVMTAATYTVTASNTGGSTTFDLVITVNDAPPSVLSYSTPNVFTVGNTISPLNPTVSGNVTSFTISPALPNGLQFNTATGVISGTPSIVSDAIVYTVTAFNSGGNTSFNLVITINDVAPTGLSYSSPNVFTVGTSIAALNPVVSGTVVQYNVSPALPAGLTLNTATGIISGTPSIVSSTAGYLVTATNSGGSTSFNIIITVNDTATANLTYNSPNTFTAGTEITALSPSLTGNAVSFSVSPSLPAGLQFNTNTGVISGTPLSAAVTGNYTITASNSGGNTSFIIVITVNDPAPTGLSYINPVVYTVGNAITPLLPTVMGTIDSYSVSPVLPNGLSMNTSTGAITGIPTTITGQAVYTVTATNTGGSTSFGITITVNAVAPTNLSYLSPHVSTVGLPISITPTVTGTVNNYSIFPLLPAGLSFNSSTGVISGTPTVVDITTHTVTASNSGGSVSFDVSIVVNHVAPTGLSYLSPNIYTVNATITPLQPTVTGTIVNYTVSPALPAGLNLHPITGVISGTPFLVTPTSTYVVSANNTGGVSTFNLVITVNAVAPSGLSYNSPNVFTVGSTIAALNPTISGSVTSYSVSPALPESLTLNTTTGVISGTPTTVTPTSSYTVTATNSGGSTSFNIVITVNAVAPSGLSYNSPNVFTVGSAIVPLNPSTSGSVISYSVSPALPAGLSLNTSTGVISGTPTTFTSVGSYAVTANNSGGSISFNVVITVNAVAPSGLSYNTPNVFTIGSAIAALNPTISGNVTSYSITPALPVGLSLNISTGVISGTPTAVTSIGSYTITATNSGGSTSFNISITVNALAPSGLSYNSPNVYTVGSPIVALNPTVSGSVISYSVFPELPPGLSLNTTTGVVSGTPTATAATGLYTITATNSGGGTSYNVGITVNGIAPFGLSYNSPNVFIVGSAVTALSPTVSGTVTSFSVTPGLPAGLSLNTLTGVISGTPSAVTSTSAYTISANNNGGSTTFNIIITVNAVAPSGLSYNSPNVFTVGSTIAALNPTISGSVTGYSVSPALPAGLIFDTITGVISGIPTSVTSTGSYTVTAANSGGSTSFDIIITVNAAAPTGLSYNSPNIFTVASAITALSPAITGSVTSFSVSPALPDGLSLDTLTGVISGTPTSVTSTGSYTVTAVNSGGSTSFDILITVNATAPTGLSYNSPNIFTVASAITALNPAITGSVTNYGVSPALPDGLSLNTSTGQISGTPTTITATNSYTVTAFNSGGSTSFDVVITVNAAAPTGLSYNSPNVFTVGSAIAALNPTISGSVTGYSVGPALPAGLIFDTITGVISGIPTSVTSTGSYTVTAANSGGSTSFDIIITVNAVAPTGLSYNSPNIFTVASAITALSPAITGSITNYSVSPALPVGLSLDTLTGVISGTPTSVTSTGSYTVTATNSGGTTSFDIIITVNAEAPTGLSYNSPNIFTVASAITALNPTITGSVTSFSVSPALPIGLSLNTLTGQISGTPTTITTTTSYTVTAFNSGGSTTFDVVITVNSAEPSGLSYIASNVFTVGMEITALTPTVTGNVTNFSVFPALPAGLSIDPLSGIISGTPTVSSWPTSYTITATNSFGSTTFNIMITVNDIPPTALSYNSPNVFGVGNSVNLAPTVTGVVNSYTIVPALPAGLQFNSSTGIISGTPTEVTATATYTVTANNSGGNTSFDVVITINDTAPLQLSYSSPNVFNVGSAISPLLPSVTGNVTNYTVVPGLPTGLSLNPATGAISGTPTEIAVTSTYTVTAVNSGGDISFDIVITVNDSAPLALSYTSPNIFTVGTTINALIPTVSGNVTGYSITPNLPAGLSFDIVTGVISGTPTEVSPTANYTVTASNSGGETTFEISITVNDIAPDALSYISPNIFTVGTTINALIPTISGNVTGYSITPTLPAGLSFDIVTGVISGTPTEVSPPANYTVTASNSGGEITFEISITVNDITPSMLSYNSPNLFAVGVGISPLIPTVTGNITGYSITPGLPEGLSFDVATGIISGTPTAESVTTSYTVTAINSGGSTSFDVVITVNAFAPSALSYNSPNVFTTGTEISALIPTVTGNVTGYSISPSLPDGLTFDPVTGTISGTPTTVTPTAVYTVSAYNSGGSTSFDVVITVDQQLGVTPSELEAMKIYPNPFVDVIYLSGFDNNIIYKLYSVDGKLIVSGRPEGSRILFRELASGAYMLHLSLGSQTVIRKIIKD